MKQILTIARITWKSAFRYKLFWVLSTLLVAAVVALPLLLKDDGTAEGMTQILLTYTLSAITGLLGFATLWLSCGTMAHDVDECYMQVIAVKPVARWQIWLGKWLGIVSLDFILLGISGICVYSLLHVRANQLPASQQAVLRREIFVARDSLKPPIPNLTPLIDKYVDEAKKKAGPELQGEKLDITRKQIEQRIVAESQVIPSGMMRTWRLDFSASKGKLKGKTLQARIKFHSAVPDYKEGTLYRSCWEVGAPNSPRFTRLQEQELPADSFQEFDFPGDAIDDNGFLFISFVNMNEMALLFGSDDGLEILFPEGSFEVNFGRGLGIILCWLALLSAIGLAAASWLSFSVAAFFSIAVLIVGMSSSTFSNAIEQGTVLGLNHETNRPTNPIADKIALPIFKGTLAILQLVEDFSPIDSLSTGRSITWGQLATAILQIVGLIGGIFIIGGISLFTRRELASVQSTS